MEIIKNNRQDSEAQASAVKSRGRPRKTTTVSKHNAKRSPKQQRGRGSEETTAEEDENADEEDCSAEHDDNEDEDDEPKEHAPSSSFADLYPFARMGKGDSDTLSSDEEGNLPNANMSAHWMGRSKRATKHSKDSAVSLFDHTAVANEPEPSDSTVASYPRGKSRRRLSNNDGLYVYDGDAVDVSNAGKPAVAIQTDDDDDYAAVDLISDSEADAAIEEHEENLIAQGSDNDDDSDAASELDFGIDPHGISGFFDEQMDLMPEDPNLMLYHVASPLPQPPAPRKVHFDESLADSRSVSDASSETVDIPDIFSSANVGLLTLQNTAGYETFYSPTQSDGSSYWDWQEDESSQSQSAAPSDFAGTSSFAPAFSRASASGSSFHEFAAGGSSDSESGDTTETDAPPPPPPDVTPKAVLKSHKPPARRPAPRQKGRHVRQLPRLGTWKVNPNKAWATYKKGVGVVIHPPKDPLHNLARFWPTRSGASSTVHSTPVTPLRSFAPEDSGLSDNSDRPRSAFSGIHGADFMLSGLFGGASNATYQFGGQVIGPPEAFFPYKSVGSTGSLRSWEEDDAFDDDDSGEDDIDITDLIRLDYDDDDEQHEDDNELLSAGGFLDTTDVTDAFEPESPANTEASSAAMTPIQSHRNSFGGGSEWTGFTTPSYSVNSGVVNSFKNNQDRAKRLSNMPPPSEPVSISKGMRTGLAQDSFISPMRKRKSSSGDYRGAFPSFGSSSHAARPEKKQKKRNSPFSLPPRGTFAV